MKHVLFCICLTFAFGFTLAPSSAAASALKQAPTPTNKCYPLNSADMGPYELKIEDATVVSIATKKSAKACTVSYGNLNSNYRIGKTDDLIFSLISGSNEEVVVYNALKCEEIVRFAVSPSGETKITEDRLFSPAYCDCDTDKKERCECTAAKDYSVSSDCKLKLDQQKSAAATIKKIGVSFNEKAQIYHPGLPDARFLKKKP